MYVRTYWLSLSYFHHCSVCRRNSNAIVKEGVCRGKEVGFNAPKVHNMNCEPATMYTTDFTFTRYCVLCTHFFGVFRTFLGSLHYSEFI